MKLLAGLVTFALIGALAGCGEKVDSAADKAAADVKAKVVADAKAAEALLKEKEAQEIGIEAYMYAYPLVTMELTRRVMTNVDAPEGSKAPMGQFARLRGYPAVDNHTVTAPNADTLYTIVWLDVGKEPWIINMPDMKGRFFLFPMLDGWTNVFADPGKRTTGTDAQKYAITGPGWTRNAAGGREGIQVANRHGLAARSHLLHRHARGLQGGARGAGPDDGACRCRPTASRTRRRPARSIQRST